MKSLKPAYILLGLFLLLLLSFALRINQWYVFLGADEVGITGVMTWTWDFYKDPFPVHYYPPFFLYLNFVFSLILKKIALFLGLINFNNAFLGTEFGYLFTLKAGRLLAAIFGTLNIYMIYLIGREFFNKKVAFLSAALLAVSWPHVIDSHNFKSDILLSFLLSVVVYFALKFYKTSGMKFILLASFFLGLSVASKYNGAFAVFLILAVIILKKKETGFIKTSIYSALCAAAGFFLAAPNWIVHPVKNIKTTLAYLDGLAKELVWYDPFPSSYILYGKNLLENFGLILAAVFILGAAISLIRRNRTQMLILLFIGAYFIIVGRANYLNYRAILPLFAFVALIIAKTIIDDLAGFIKNKKVLISYFIAAGLFVSVYTFSNFEKCLKSFNLLKVIASHPVKDINGVGRPDYSHFYLKNHINKKHSFFREMWTPPVPGFKGSMFGRDINKLNRKRFSAEKGFDFLITSFRSDYLLNKTRNQVLKKEAHQRIKHYLPMYKVFRPRIFTWSNDIQFWYRRPGYIKNQVKQDHELLLPRLFYNDPENQTIFLPLQRYEKNPCFGKIVNTIFGKYIVSLEKLKGLKFSLLNSKGRGTINISINGRNLLLNLDQKPKIINFQITDPKPEVFKGVALRRLYEVDLDKQGRDTALFIYRVELTSRSRTVIPFVFTPLYENGQLVQAQKPKIQSGQQGKTAIPALFSSQPVPGWVKDFYQDHGIDLVLLSYLNSREIFRNDNYSVKDVDTGIFLVGPGSYQLVVETSRISPDADPRDQCEADMVAISETGETVTRVKIDQGQNIFRFKNPSGFRFYRFKTKRCSRKNLIIGRILLSVDYAGYLIPGDNTGIQI